MDPKQKRILKKRNDRAAARKIREEKALIENQQKETLIIDLYDAISDLHSEKFVESAEKLGIRLCNDGSVRLRSSILHNGIDGTVQQHFKKVLEDISSEFGLDDEDFSDGTYETQSIDRVNDFVDNVNSSLKSEMFKIPDKSVFAKNETLFY